MNRIATWLLVALLIPIHAFAHHRFAAFWEMSEIRLDTEQGGRANSIAVNPQNANEMFVASDSGGLFKTEDGGLIWTHIEGLPIFTQDVAYVDSNIVLVSALADFKTGGGGVWRSANGGMSWDPVDLEFNGRLSAYGISVGSGGSPIVVGTSEGVFLSFNGGLNWTHSNVFTGDKRVFSVLVESGDPYRIYAAGPMGVRVATTNPITEWMAPPPGSGVGTVLSVHALARSPLSNLHAYAANVSGLRETTDGGRTWSRILSAPAGTLGCRGRAFIRVNLRYIHNWPWLELYYGNGCALHRLNAQVFGVPDYSGTWQPASIGSASPRDLALVGGDPALLASSRGLHVTADRGQTWTSTAGPRTGYNALQINEMKGQWIAGLTSPDLYVGTQDNNMLAANPSGDITGPSDEGPDGFFIDAAQQLDFSRDSQITYSTGNSCCNRISDRRLANPRSWDNAPRFLGAPIFLRQSQHIQNVGGSITSAGLDLTRDAGDTWEPFARFFERPTGIATVGRIGDIDLTTLVYQPHTLHVNAPFFSVATRLIRIEKLPFPLGTTVSYPAPPEFGGLGFNHPLNVVKPIFGVDPGNGWHIIAPDVLTTKMMETTDGGESWHEIPDLTNDVTDSGNLLFRTNLQGTGPTSPVVTAVSFCPDNPNLVLIGTAEGGIFYSSDNGDHWARIGGTEPATYVTSFYWQDANNVFVSTFGRGLWKLVNTQIALPEAFDEFCGGTCNIGSNDGKPGSPPFDGGAFVFEGQILGVRTDDQQLREIFITPGSSVVFTGDQKDPQQDITITVSDGRDTSQYTPLPKPPDGWIAAGVVFTTGDMLTGTVFAESKLSLVPPPSKEHYEGSTKSPVEGTPYIRLTTSGFNGAPSVMPEETFDLDATDFVAGASYEVLIDGVPMKGELTADAAGSFNARIPAPSTCGYHKLEVRMAGEEEVIDSSLLFVNYAN